MGNKKGYIVLEVGYEYNDEYYHTGNGGNMYEAPKKVFIDKEQAIVELEKKTIEKLKGESLGNYNGNGLEGICEKGMTYEFRKIFKEDFDIDLDEDEYDIQIPKNASNESLKKIIECMKLKFFELVEVELN